MNIKTLIDILHLADPANNAPLGERMNALKQAHKIMDRERISYASIGFSPEDAARIENQFSVAEPVSAPKRAKWHWGFSPREPKQTEPREWRDASGGAAGGTSDKMDSFDYHYQYERDYQGPAPICLD